jgi:hypothetical protein
MMRIAHILFVLFVVFIDCSNIPLSELRELFNGHASFFNEKAQRFELKDRSVIPRIPPIEALELESQKFEILHSTYLHLVKEIYAINNRVSLGFNLKLIDHIVSTHLSPIAQYYNAIVNFKPASRRIIRENTAEIKFDRHLPAILCLVQLYKIPIPQDRFHYIKKSGFFPFSVEAFPEFQRILDIRFQSIKKGQMWTNDDLLRSLNSYANALEPFDPKSSLVYKFLLEKHLYKSHHSSFCLQMISIFQNLKESNHRIFIESALPSVGEILRMLGDDEKIIRFKSFLKAGFQCAPIIYYQDKARRMNLKILNKIYHLEYALLMIEREKIPPMINDQINLYIDELVFVTPPIKEVRRKWDDYSFSQVLSAYSGFVKACEKHTWGKREVMDTIINQIRLYSPLIEEQAALIYQQHVFLKWRLEEMRGKFQSDFYATNKRKMKLEELSLVISKSKRYMNMEYGFNTYFTLKRDENFETLATSWLMPIVLEKLQRLKNSKTKPSPSPRDSRKAEEPADLVDEAIALVNRRFSLRFISNILRNQKQSNQVKRNKQICQIIVDNLNGYLAIDLKSYRAVRA